MKTIRKQLAEITPYANNAKNIVGSKLTMLPKVSNSMDLCSQS